jgi:AcrR family transcriptional regulator
MVIDERTDKKDPRTAVVSVATRLFAAHGFDGTSLQAIADELGLTKAAVLHHFASKEALRAAVLETIFDHFRELLPALLLRATASKDRFESIFGEVHHFFASAPDRARLLLREALDRPEEMKRLLRDRVRPWLEGVVAYAESGRRFGRHHPDLDPEAYTLQASLAVITSAGTAAVLSAALEGRDGRGRLERELRRMTRSSLFAPDHPEPRDKRSSP